MKIQATFWQQLKSATAELVRGDEAVTDRASQIMDLAVGSTLIEQHEAAAELFDLLGRLPNAMDLAFQLGRGKIRPTAFGDLSMVLQVAPNVADAMRVVCRFYGYEVPLIEFSFLETATEGRVTIGFRHPLSNRGEALVTAICVCMADAKIQRITGRSQNIKRLELTPASSAYEPGYRKHFFIVPETHHQSNVFVLDRSVLEVENPHADPHTYDNILSVYAAREELQGNGLGAASRVRERVMSSIGAPPAFDHLANLMRLTPRQLRLVLAREKSSYQAIVRSCRVEYATALFRDPTISLSEIAHRLGYSDLSAFTHAFNRWTGCSPSRFRRELESRASATTRFDH